METLYPCMGSPQPVVQSLLVHSQHVNFNMGQSTLTTGAWKDGTVSQHPALSNAPCP